jgi:hypothetical protein
MKRKIITILFALVLVLSLSLVMAAPAAAATAVTSVWVSFAAGGNALSNAAVYTIYFTPTTALQRGIDTITVAFPDGIDLTMGAYTFDLSTAQTTATYYTFGVYSLVATSAATLWNTSYQRVNITTPVDMAAGTAGYFVITASAAIKTAATAGNYHIKLWTSKDTTPVLSSAFPVDGSVVSAIAAYAAPSSLVAGAATSYTFSFTSATAVTTDGTVTVEFPLGTYLPATIAASAVYAGDDASNTGSDPHPSVVTVDTVQRTVTVTPGEELGASTLNYVYFTTSAGILNPTLAGAKTIFVWTSTDGQKVAGASLYTIVAGTATKLAFNVLTSDDATIINAFTVVLKLEAQDAYGNINTAETTTTLVSVTTGTGTVHTAAGAEGNLWGTSQALTAGADDVFYRPTTAGTHVLTATVVLGTAMTAGTWTVYVAPAVVLKDAGGTTINSYSPASGTYTAGLYGGAYIQAAINAASAGDTVELGSGIYELSTTVNLNKAITLKAATGTTPIIRNTADNLGHGTGQAVGGAILVGIAGSLIHPVVIDGLTFQRLVLGTDICTAICNDGYDYVTVRNCTFNYIQPDANSSFEGVIWFRNSNNITSATISNNTFNSCVTSWPDIGGSKSGCIIFSTADPNKNVDGVVISGNTLTNCGQYGITFGGHTGKTASASITNNTITNGYSSIDLCDYVTTANITGNTITGAYNYGIQVEGTNNTGIITIKSNSITGTAGTGAAIRSEQTGATTLVVIQYNDLYNNNGSAILTAVANDCKYNYYGSTSGPGLLLVSGTTVTSPWLYVSKATVVTNNASYPAVSKTLAVGWNTLSTPAKLIAAADSIDELVPTGSSIAYYYSGGWQLVTTGYVLNPCNAVYIKMTTAQTALLQIDGATTYVPSKDLAAGWNLIGQTNLTGAETDLQAVASVAANYGQLVSPSLNAVAWINTSSTASTGSLVLGEGYWIFMKTAATIGGFTICPIAPDLD